MSSVPITPDPRPGLLNAPSFAEALRLRLCSVEPGDVIFAQELRKLATPPGNPKKLLRAALAVTRHLGLDLDEKTVGRVQSAFGRSGMVVRERTWRTTLYFRPTAGDQLGIVAHCWLDLAQAATDFVGAIDTNKPSGDCARSLDDATRRVRLAHASVVAPPKAPEPSPKAKGGSKLRPTFPKPRSTPPSMRSTLPEGHVGRFLEGGAPGLGKRA
jgi:hypothetical protein